MKLTKRKGFNFLRSYFDVLNELPNDQDKLEFLMAVINKQFLDVDPELNGIVKFAYISQLHAIEKSVKGWKDATKQALTDALPNPPGGCMVHPRQQEKEQEKEKEQEQSNISSTKVDFDFNSFLDHINQTFKKNYRVVNDKAKRGIKARLKDGYTKRDIFNAINNVKMDQYHKDSDYKYATAEYFSRSKTLDIYGQELPIKNEPKYNGR